MNWKGFLEDCENEEYVMCDVTIDGQTVREVGIRAKGNTSLTQVKNYGNDRYSFKLELTIIKMHPISGIGIS